MKIAEIVIGGEYETKIGETFQRVIVVRAEEPIAGYKKPRFRVRRVGEARVLPKTRDASALRPVGFREGNRALRRGFGASNVEAGRVETPPEIRKPAWESKARSTRPGCSLVLGIVQHHFHGTYSATVALGFRGTDLDHTSPEEGVRLAAEAAARLNDLLRATYRQDLSVKESEDWFPWVVGRERPWVLTRSVDSEQLKVLVQDLSDPGPGWFFELRAEPCGFIFGKCGTDGGEHHKDEIAGVPHSIDVGPAFTVEMYLPSLDKQKVFTFDPVQTAEDILGDTEEYED